MKLRTITLLLAASLTATVLVAQLHGKLSQLDTFQWWLFVFLDLFYVGLCTVNAVVEELKED